PPARPQRLPSFGRRPRGTVRLMSEGVKGAAAPGRTALVVLGACFAMGLTGRGLVECFTVFLLPLSRSFGWERAETVSIYSLAMLTSGLAAPLVGRLFDRSGPRTVYVLGLVLIGTG